MSIFHCGSVCLPGGHGARDHKESLSAKRTTYIPGRRATQIFRALVVALALALAIGFVGSGNQAAAEMVGASSMESVSVFGAVETKVKKSKSFKSWGTLLKRYAKQEVRLAKGRGRMNEKAGSKLWNQLIDSLRGLDRTTQIEKVNSYFNTLTHQSDSKNYDVEDYWATPYQFLSRAKGDCEDFAAAKYLALRALGFESSQLCLVVGYDRARGAAHTVTLAVVDGQVLMLDIGDNAIVEMAGVTGFDPFYSVTESDGWLHMKRA